MAMLCRDSVATAPSKAANTIRVAFLSSLRRVVLFGGLDSSTAEGWAMTCANTRSKAP